VDQGAQQRIVARHVELAGVAVVAVDQHHACVQRGGRVGGSFVSGSGKKKSGDSEKKKYPQDFYKQKPGGEVYI